jgi:hypothetical protein
MMIFLADPYPIFDKRKDQCLVDFEEYVLVGPPSQFGEAFQEVKPFYSSCFYVKDHAEDFMMFCDVDAGVINRYSWSRVRGYSRENYY